MTYEEHEERGIKKGVLVRRRYTGDTVYPPEPGILLVMEIKESHGYRYPRYFSFSTQRFGTCAFNQLEPAK
jgi:hypothetical protein